jgi:hypothetical protein
MTPGHMRIPLAELREHAEHVEEALSRRGTGVDRLLCRLERGALRLHGPDDVLQVADTSVTKHHRHVTDDNHTWPLAAMFITMEAAE